jgi:hypothetical protein
LPPRGQPAEGVVEIHVAANVVDIAHIRQAAGMPQPGAAMHKRQPRHPVGVIVYYQEVKRARQALDQRETDVMEIAGAIERQLRFVIERRAQ